MAMESYDKTPWVDGSTPPINAQNLNKIEQGIYDNREGINNKQDWFCNPVEYSGTGQTLNAGDDQIMFVGKYRFTPHSEAPENQYDLINRQMLAAELENKQKWFATVDPTDPDYYELSNQKDARKIRFLSDYFRVSTNNNPDGESIMNFAMVERYISDMFDILLTSRYGFDGAKNQVLAHDDSGVLRWVDSE